MTSLALVLLLGVTAAASQETRRIPDDSVEIVTRGCLKGRVFTATPRPKDEGTVKGPDVTGRHFRVAGPREVMDLVRKYNGQLVEVVGVVLKSAVGDEGVRLGGSGVVVGAPRTDPTRMNTRTTPVGGQPTMDLSAVRFLAESCPIS